MSRNGDEYFSLCFWKHVYSLGNVIVCGCVPDNLGNFDEQFFLDPALLAMYAGAIYFPYSGEEGMVMEYVRKQMWVLVLLKISAD